MGIMKIDLTGCAGFFNEKEFENSMINAENMAAAVDLKTGEGNNYLGWSELPVEFDKKELERIKQTAERIQEQSDYLVNIGIGGSYLGTKALDDALNHKKKGVTLLYTGNSLSGTELNELMEFIENKRVSLNVVSKSGTTTEPAIAFRIMKEYMHKKYGESAKERIYVVTDGKKGAVKSICDREGYTRFVIPDDIGGRYSVLTPVGLLPLASAGTDIDALLEGAGEAYRQFKKSGNSCYAYAAARNILYEKGKTMEIMAVYESSMRYFAEWWKQLFAESEGKDGKGIFPTSVVFSADLHSLGQYIQQGLRNIFETVLAIENPPLDIEIPDTGSDEDGLEYLAGKSLNFVNRTAMKATINAHIDGGVPNILLSIPMQNERYLGQLVYFYERACAISGYMLGVNPFNQPGVEKYKKEMFRLLGKPGY